MLRKIPVIGLIISFIVFMSRGTQSQLDSKELFHTEGERSFFSNHKIMSPIGPGEYFQPSSSCRGCHGTDSAGLANIDESGNDVNLFDHWQSTMMANSSRDPLWRAKVSHEILVNPAHANDLQNTCTTCHAPMGRYTAFYHGIANYGLSDLATDSLGADGVACASCHTISDAVGSTFSGVIPYDTTRNIYGPFTLPLQGPMQLYEGYTPMYSAHMNESRLCSSCHTLITQTADTNGAYTGGTFTEQATYHEYLNSNFPGDSITCQTCHMPHLDDAIVIANGFASLDPRYPFNQHVFVGSNTFMITMIKNNKTQIGATAEDWQFDTTIAATNALLRERSILFSLNLDSSANDTAYLNVRIENKAGHKFPSGYPARRAVLQFVMIDSNNDTVFKSGIFTSDYRVAGETPSFEPHHDIISQSNIPQIYEMAMGDVNNNFTSVLERSAVLLKDNRIPPAGFTTASSVYDTVQISNDALADPDFNKINSVEGSAVDLVHFRVSLATVTGKVSIYAKMYFQSVPPKWVDEMFAYSSAEIDSFQNMFNNADQTPLLIASDSIVDTWVGMEKNHVEENTVNVFPSVSGDGKVVVSVLNGAAIKQIAIYNSEGKKVNQMNLEHASNSYLITLPSVQGMYLLKIETGGKIFYRKVIRQ